MAVLGSSYVALDVPDLNAGVAFYRDAGLDVTVDGAFAYGKCAGSDRNAIVLRGGAVTKKLNHVALRADDLDAIAKRVPQAGGRVIAAPDGWPTDGLWIEDIHGMRIRLVEQPPEMPLPSKPAFEINSPGRLIRRQRAAILPLSNYAPVRPLRLGHVLVFTPDVLNSVAFVTNALGMGLADGVADIVAFCCARKNSDHHVLAFAKSEAIGFHHASFQVHDPDEVGRGGRALVEKAGRGDWGFGRHAIGSNFFHYIQDPWGSWFEYYSDIDYIEDHASWTRGSYEPHEALASWGPALPPDFITNYEAQLKA
jgi:catechol 2,3-dioxygenase-like lactoylglutathione lyase family enzyme